MQLIKSYIHFDSEMQPDLPRIRVKFTNSNKTMTAEAPGIKGIRCLSSPRAWFGFFWFVCLILNIKNFRKTIGCRILFLVWINQDSYFIFRIPVLKKRNPLPSTPVISEISQKPKEQICFFCKHRNHAFLSVLFCYTVHIIWRVMHFIS